MEQPVQILLIEDSPLFVTLTRRMLGESKSVTFDIECVDHLSAGMTRIAQGGIDVVLLDLTLPDSNGLDTFLSFHKAAKDIPTVVYTSVDDETLSLSALNHGAADYLVKSEVNANWLARSLIYAIQRSQPHPGLNKSATSDEPAGSEVIQTTRSTESDSAYMVRVNEKRLVTAATLELLKETLLKLLRRSDCEEVHVEMSDVDYISNAAISMLLIVHKRSTAANKRMVLVGLNSQVHEQFSSRRFDKLFDLRRGTDS